MLSPEEHKRARFLGEAFAASSLANLVRGGMTPEMAESYATGMVDAVGAFVLAYVSERAAYDLLQQAADRVPAERARATS